MDLPYWVYQDYFIFKPEFNGSVDEYVNIIIDYKKLIFSNYPDLDSSIQIINGKIPNNRYIGSNFSQPLTNSLIQLINLTNIIFGHYFNKPLANSLDKLINLTHLTFGFTFNQPLANSFDKLTNLIKITFGFNFNQPIADSFDKLTNLTQITFGCRFNQLPRKFLQNFLELHKINLCLFY